MLWVQWDGRDLLAKAAACLGTLFSGPGGSGSSVRLAVNRVAEGCDARAVLGAMRGLSRVLCKQWRTCLLLHGSGAQRNGSAKGHVSCHMRPVHPDPFLGFGKLQLRTTQHSPKQETCTLPCPSHALLAFGLWKPGPVESSGLSRVKGQFNCRPPAGKEGYQILA